LVVEVMRSEWATRPARIDDRLHVRQELDVPRSSHIALDHQPLRLLAMIRGAEAETVDRHRGPPLVLGKQLRDRRSDRRAEELVDVYEGEPPCVVAVTVEAIGVGAHL